jgi:hypothetical protein
MPPTEKTDTAPVELVSALPSNTTELIERTEIDCQIATAKKYPRSIEAFKNRAISMATIDEETAESCLYRRPVGMKDGQQQYAEGMSIRMAEIVGASYGNLRVAASIVQQNERFVKARGMAIDLESNFAASSETVESTVKKNGQPYDERMRVVIAKAALAKALRDATFKVVPRALAKPVEAAVRKLLMGDAQTLAKRRDAVVGWINKLGIDPKRVWAALHIGGPADIGVEQLETLTGIRTAIKDGDSTIDDAFPDPDAPKGSATTGAKDSPKTEATESDQAADAETIEKLVAKLSDYEGEVNIYLRDVGWVGQTETYRNLSAKRAAEILKNLNVFLDAVGVKKAGK